MTLRSTENWVHIPLKEISDANKLFCARCSGYWVAPKTKLCVTLLTSTKFVFLLPGRHGALRGMPQPFFTLAFEPEQRVKHGVTAEDQRSCKTEPEWGAFDQFTEKVSQQPSFLLGYNKHALSVVLGCFEIGVTWPKSKFLKWTQDAELGFLVEIICAKQAASYF